MTRNLEVKTEKERWNPGDLPKIRTRLYRVLIFLISPQTGLPTEVFIAKPKNKPCIGPVYDFAMMRQFELHCPESIRWFPAKRSAFWRRTVL